MSVNFLDVIKSKAKLWRPNHIDNIIQFDSHFKFHLLNDKKYYVLAIRVIGKDCIEKIRYSLNGVIISRVTDNVINNHIHRVSGEKRLILDGNKVTSISKNIKLKAIEIPESRTKTLFVENIHIGVIDTETYRTNDNSFKIYALGFKT